MLTLVLVAAALYALLCLAFWIWQDKLLYFPGPPPRTTPAALGLEYRELAIDTADGERLHAWLIPPRPPIPGGAGGAGEVGRKRGVVLVCHGNAGGIDLRLELAQAFADMGLSTLLFDYRGYGASTGRASEAGTYADAEAAHAHLVSVEGFAPGEIVAFGESLGGAVVIELALRHGLAAVIAQDTFTSIPDIGSELYPWLPVRLLGRTRYDSAAKIGRLTVPVLVMHSRDDEIVPFAHGRTLYEAAREPKRFLETAGGHSGGGFQLREEWTKVVRDFVEGAL